MTVERPKYIEQLMNARGNGLVRHDENGIVTMGLMHFLSDKNSLEA